MGLRDVLNYISRDARLQRKIQRLRQLIVEQMTGEAMDAILELLLRAMSLFFAFNKQFRRHIQNFKGRYAFISQDGVGVSAIFSTIHLLGIPRMRVSTRAVKKTNTTIVFKDGSTIAEFLLSPNPDIYAGIMDRKLSINGNLSYILKFIYMARCIPELLGLPASG